MVLIMRLINFCQCFYYSNKTNFNCLFDISSIILSSLSSHIRRQISYMLNQYTRKDYYNPFPQSAPYIKPQSLHDDSQSNDSVNMNINHRYISDKYDINQTQTQRATYSQQRFQNTHSFQMRNNSTKNQKTTSLTQQLSSYKLNRNPHHTKNNQVYKNPTQTYKDLDNPSQKKDLRKINHNDSYSQNSYNDNSQGRGRIQQSSKNKIQNDKSCGKQNENRMTSRPKSGHLVSFGSLSSFKQNPSVPNSNHNSKNSSLNKVYQRPQIYDKQNNQPNSSYNNSQSDYQSQQGLKKITTNQQNRQTNEIIKLNDTKTKTLFYEHSSNQINTDFVKKNKTTRSQSQLLMPILNTMGGESHRRSESNFHSNSIIDQSSISPLCDSSRISQQDTQIAYLKQKLVQTHSKLIKQLQISKQLQDNFFSLKKKYQTLLNSNKNIKSPQNSQKQIYQLQSQLKNKSTELQKKQQEFKRKQEEFKRKQEEHKVKQQKWTQKQASLFNQLSQQRKKQSENVKQLSFLNQKIISLKQQISALNNECNHLNQQVNTLSQQVWSYKGTIQELQNEKQKLKFQLDQVKKNQNCLNQKINQLQLMKYSSGDLHQILQCKEAVLNQKINQNKNNFIQQSQKLIQKNLQLKNDLQNMRNKVLSLNKQKEQLSQELQQLNQSNQDYQIQISNLQEKLSKKNKEFSQKEELCEIWRKKYSQTQEQSKKTQENIIRHQNQIKQLKNLNSQLNIALRQEKQKNAQMLSEIINIQMQTKDLKTKIHTLQEQKKQLQDKLFQVTPQKNILHQKQQLEHQLQKLTTEYNSLSAILNKKDKDISELKAQLLEFQSAINKFSVKEKELEQKSRQLDQKLKEVEQRQIQLEQQKMNNMSSVKNFVNQLQDQKDRSLALKRTSQQLNRQNRSKTPTHIQKQNVFNSNLKNQSSYNNNRSLSPVQSNNIKIIPYEDKRSQRTSDQQNHQIYHQQNRIQSQNICLTPSKSLNNLNVKNLMNNNSHSFLNLQKDNLLNPKMTQKKLIRQSRDFNDSQNLIAEYQSYEDSLQTNNVQIHNVNSKKQIRNEFQNQQDEIQFLDNKKQRLIVDEKSYSATPFKENKNSLTVSQSKPKLVNGSQKCLSSYKEEKEQYLCLLQEIGELETQSYNLGQEKRKILQELERIENTKVKTKQMIAKRRQLELYLLGNEKKNNEVREKLKNIRGKVV